MTIPRRIRHALLAFIAAFLLAVLFVPTHEARTVWTIFDPADPSNQRTVSAAGISTTPIESRSRLPRTLVAVLRWRLMMSQHYADQEIQRGLAQTLNAEDGHTGHRFWTRQHERAAAAYDELMALDQAKVIASPTATLPGLPTRFGISLAILCGLGAALLMLAIDWHAYRRESPNEIDDNSQLHLPASWFQVQQTPVQRLAWAGRVVCVIVILSTAALLLTSTTKEMGIDRLTKWPLAEVADFV